MMMTRQACRFLAVLTELRAQRLRGGERRLHTLACALTNLAADVSG
jgi:hypothetical protein